MLVKQRTVILRMSVRKDKTSLMSKLIELGGEPACRDNEGRSCLHLAANNDSASAARILLQHKVRRGNIHTDQQVTGYDVSQCHICIYSLQNPIFKILWNFLKCCYIFYSFPTEMC